MASSSLASSRRREAKVNRALMLSSRVWSTAKELQSVQQNFYKLAENILGLHEDWYDFLIFIIIIFCLSWGYDSSFEGMWLICFLAIPYKAKTTMVQCFQICFVEYLAGKAKYWWRYSIQRSFMPLLGFQLIRGFLTLLLTEIRGRLL